MTIGALPVWLVDLGSASAVVASVLGAGGLAWRALRSIVDELDERIQHHTEPIASQLVANGGHSLRDVVDRVEQRVEKVEGKCADIKVAMHSLEDRIERLERRADQDHEIDLLGRQGRLDRRNPEKGLHGHD